MQLLGLTEWRLRESPAEFAAGDTAVGTAADTAAAAASGSGDVAVADPPATAAASPSQVAPPDAANADIAKPDGVAADVAAADAATATAAPVDGTAGDAESQSTESQFTDSPSPESSSTDSTSRSEPVPTQWEPLQAHVAGCTACALHTGRTQTVFGVGQPTADLMLVGEGPGAAEDAQGEPFVGAAGQLLDRMLAAIGHSRADTVYIANVVKCRPPGNRKPHASEAAACSDYLAAQIALVQPKLIVALGQIAATQLTGTDAPVARMRQGEHRYTPGDIPVMVTYHPAYYLRQPLEKRKGWEDLKRIRARLAELS